MSAAEFTGEFDPQRAARLVANLRDEVDEVKTRNRELREEHAAMAAERDAALAEAARLRRAIVVERQRHAAELLATLDATPA